MRWTYTPPPADEVGALSRSAGVSPVLAELLWRLEIADDAEVGRFLRPALSDLGDPFDVENLEAAAHRIAAAIHGRESVVVLGDYDVDGVSSTTLLVSVLRRFGLEPRFIVPRRLEDGYGLSRSVIDRALAEGCPDLFIALDCGTNSIEEVDYLRSQGVDVIVVDHHRSREEGAVEQAILINPHVHPTEEDEAWRNLCTVGLVFKLAHGLLKHLRQENHPVAFRVKLRDYLDLVAMGTVADLVPLRGENRLMARYGLHILGQAARPGLHALMQISGVRPELGVHPVDISFRLGPRINASGRLADAALAVELMLSEDSETGRQTAEQLDRFNRERQDIERAITEEAERLIETHYANDAGIVLYADEWHPGVVGIVAGRVSRKYNRPCVVLGNEGKQAKGSGRSIAGINLVKVLADCAEHLTSWGGHPMAVGVGLMKPELEGFRTAFCAAIEAHVGGEIDEPELPVSCWVAAEQIDHRLMEELDALHPFGQANSEPIFGVRGVCLTQAPGVFKSAHIRFNFEVSSGRRLFGVGWKMADRVPPVGEPIDLAVHLRWNHFNDRKLLQLDLVDWRRSESAG
jgi:single-stranded-DNA-specific exonuclease